MSEMPRIIVSSTDYCALTTLLPVIQSSSGESLDQLRTELQRAAIFDRYDIPANVVTMNSRVRFVVDGGERPLEMTLCYPQDVDDNVQNVSVTAPLGSALLGHEVGQTIEWALPDGQTKHIRVQCLLYQPERSANFMD